jgi:hypothetical protein
VIKLIESKLIDLLNSALKLLHGDGEAEIAIVGSSCLIRFDSILRLNSSFIVELIRIQELVLIDSFVIDEGASAGCMEISGRGLTIVHEFEGYQKLFSEVYETLDSVG